MNGGKAIIPTGVRPWVVEAVQNLLRKVRMMAT